MEPASEEKRILSIENRVNSLTLRLSELERRLGALERAAGISLTPKPQEPAPAKVKQTYLRRAIDTAKRDYERKYR